MKDDVSRLLRAARPPEFEPGTAVDAATRERELAKAFASFSAAGGVASAGAGARAARGRRPRVVATRAVAGLAAACLVAVGVWAAGLGTQHPSRGPGHGTPKPVRTVRTQPIDLLDAPVAGPMSAAAADAGMPTYYVVLDHLSPVADIRSSATGNILSSVPLPPAADPKLTQIAATGDDRTFVLAVFANPLTSFYLLRVGDDGRSASLTTLGVVRPFPAGKYVMDMAVSPDGTRLAVAIQFSGGHGAIEVINLRTGAVRTWTTSRVGQPTQLSWADHGRELGFFWLDDGPGGGADGGLWVLDTGRSGGSLLSGRLVLPGTVGDDAVQSALLSPDGKSIDASVTYAGVSRVRRGTVVGGIVEISVRTGRPLRTLLAEHAAFSGDPESRGWYITTCQLLSDDVTGNHLLVSCDRFGRLDRARFTALPGSPPQTVVATAW